MGQPSTPLLTHEQYLAAEEAANVRSEYVAGVTWAMVGTSLRHNAISLNFFRRLDAHLKRRCDVFLSDVKVHVASADAYYYPDLIVRCGGGLTGAQLVVTDPGILVEVLSPGTEAVDRNSKLRAYQSLTSLTEYVLVSQDEQMVELYRRHDLGWLYVRSTGEQLFALESIGFTSPVSALYEHTDVTA